MDAERVKGMGQQPRHDGAVLQRVADAGWRLRAGSHYSPLAIGAAREVERDQVQKHAVRRTSAMAGTKEARMPEDQRRRQQALTQQRLRAVDVGRDGVQQPRALAQAAAEPLPLLRFHDEREDVEAPRAL